MASSVRQQTQHQQHEQYFDAHYRKEQRVKRKGRGGDEVTSASFITPKDPACGRRPLLLPGAAGGQSRSLIHGVPGSKSSLSQGEAPQPPSPPRQDKDKAVACVCAMRVLWVCVCACLAVTEAGRWADRAKDELKIDVDRMETVPSSYSNDITLDITVDFGVSSESTTESTISTETTPLPTTTTAITPTTTTTTTETTSSSSPSVDAIRVLPSDCADLLMAGVTKSGVYYIYPFTCTCSEPILVWCDMETDGGGWTVFLKRQQQPYQLDFNRTWEEYQAGFGDPYMEYWLGLEMLHVMTYGRMYSVRLDLETTEQKEEYTTFPNIKVESEDEKYKVILAGREGGSPQTKYCFRYWSYKLFTSIDRDYDSYYRGNCANEQGGGWWYTNCRYFNPTSIYGEHIELTCPYSVQLNVTRLQLKIRPTLCDAPFKAIHLREMSCGC
ncbi:tenascin-N-like [Portunus trituberculatus]|uniref:tenascin-N-like n=1 Tax=Portunus trituberculatus TaxID=210409 RepID=UPI001E1CDA15|nr:tenascin-N-like [Portunus trituberculatus]